MVFSKYLPKEMVLTSRMNCTKVSLSKRRNLLFPTLSSEQEKAINKKMQCCGSGINSPDPGP
jgi:hypothetical protein